MDDRAEPEGAQIPLDPAEIERVAAELGMPPAAASMAFEELVRAGLFEPAEQTPDPRAVDEAAVLSRAGEQFLAIRGDISQDALFFLPDVIDDLHARAALLAAGTELVDRFRRALIAGEGTAHARTLVPPAFAEAVDTKLTFDLFAAAVALPARLGAGDPAGCVAEEILGVRMIEIAEATLDEQVNDGELGERDAAEAKGSLRGLFELFEDDDVLALFEMHEPADAARGGDEVDQRLEHWFHPFGGTSATGHLDP